MRHLLLRSNPIIQVKQQTRNKGFPGHLPEISVATGTYGDQLGGFFFLAYHNEIRPLLQAMLAYFIVNFLATQIAIDAQTL